LGRVLTKQTRVVLPCALFTLIRKSDDETDEGSSSVITQIFGLLINSR
jgi:hypothetical protein